MRNGIFLLLGSNLGDPADNLKRAGDEIRSRIGEITTSSSIYKTEPWGITDQPVFLNQVVDVKTTLLPASLLDTISAIERSFGRIRKRKWGERIIDIDILFYKDEIIHSERLDIPHRGIPFRRFTLEPLCEIAADFIHPEMKKSVAELLVACDDISAVEKVL